MCLSPILIKNVNYGNASRLGYIKDTTSQFIPVPCGRCSVCLQLKQQYLVQRVQMEAFSHDLYFGTLTYNNESLPIHKVQDYTIAYPDISDWQKMIKMIRKHEDLPPFKYFLVSEYGGRRHRPHFHFILSFPKDDRQKLAERVSFSMRLFNIFLKYWRRNYGSTRSPDWKPLCTYVRTRKSYNFDLHFLDSNSTSTGLDDVAFYVSKYCLKYDKWLDKFKSLLFLNLSEDDFKETWNLLRPRRLLSKGFGSPNDPKVQQHICKGIQLSIDYKEALYPYFISPVNGATFPLSPYFSKRFLSLNALEVFNLRKPRLTDYDMFVDSTSDLTVAEKIEKQRKFNVVQEFLDTQHTYEDDTMNDVNNFLIHNLYEYGQFNKQSFEIFEVSSEFTDCWQSD